MVLAALQRQQGKAAAGRQLGHGGRAIAAAGEKACRLFAQQHRAAMVGKGQLARGGQGHHLH
jgi:hypothetical protein